MKMVKKIISWTAFVGSALLAITSFVAGQSDTVAWLVSAAGWGEVCIRLQD